MIDCLNVARYFIKRAYQDGLEAEMTNLKVQKLLYYSQLLHLALFDKPLFEDEIQAWRYGPVCPPAYNFYSEFEAKQLPIPDEDVLSEFPDKTKDLLEKVWGCFSGYDAYFLSAMTHREFPWKNARKGLSKDASSTEPILLEDMKKLGQEKLNLIGRKQPRTPGLLKRQLGDAFFEPLLEAEFPWKNARKGLSKEVSSTEPILLEDMKALGHEKFNWIGCKQPRTPGLLKGQLGDAFLEPLSEEELQKWG
jgi:uncharacterized phage-associated protein